MKKPKIIVVIAISLDGRIAFPKGGESHIGSDLDKKLLDKSLSNIDATLFGSRTLKAHQSTYLIKRRNLFGFSQKIASNQPISIIAGNSKNFSNKWDYFNQPLKRWLISSNTNIKDTNLNFDKIFSFKDSWANTLKFLKEQEGINKIALLGGAKLIHSFIKEDLIDELKLTICPKIFGGKFTWIPFEDKNEINNFEANWNIKKIKVLKTNEIFMHYTRKFKK